MNISIQIHTIKIMHIIIFLSDINSLKNLLPVLNQSVNAVIFTENVNETDSLKFNLREYPILQINHLEKYLAENEVDYALVDSDRNAKIISSQGVSSSKILDVRGIINNEHLAASSIFVGLQKNFSSDVELVAIGGFSSLMGFRVEEYPVKGVNLSSPEQDLWMSYHWLKKVLDIPDNKIKYAVIGLSPYSLRYDLSTSDANWKIFSYYPIFKDTHNLPIDNENLISLFNENFWGIYDLMNVNLNESQQLPSVNLVDPFNFVKANNRALYRQELYGVRAEAGRWGAEKYLSNVSENSKIFTECLKLCRDNGVIPIAVTLPVHSLYKNLFPKYIADELNAVIHNAKKIYLFHYVDCFQWDMSDGREFCRIDVLNTIGAKRITVKINPLIQKFESNKIRVGFICQGGHLDKLLPVYEEMLKRDNVENFILVVPPYENYDLFANKPFNPNDERYIKAQKEVLTNYGSNKNTNIMKVMNETGLLDVESLNLDYIFYKRPYEALLPPNVRCQVTNKFTKTCYVPYGFHLTEFSLNFALNNLDFFNTLNFFFAEHEDFSNGTGKIYHTGFENSDQKFVYLGSPEMEDFCDFFARDFETNLNKKRKSVLWAPRWTYDKSAIGGSHFIEYKENFTALRKKYKNVALTVRPHPLTFPTMIRENRMTERDVELYKKSLQDNNIYLDDCADKNGLETLKTTFKKSDIMIADITSIIPLYFLSGNPVIYCPCEQVPFGNFKAVLDGLYIAEDWAEVERYVDMLLSGKDPLKDKRKEIAKELYALHNGASERIVKAIIDDYNFAILKND